MGSGNRVAILRAPDPRPHIAGGAPSLCVSTEQFLLRGISSYTVLGCITVMNDYSFIYYLIIVHNGTVTKFNINELLRQRTQHMIEQNTRKISIVHYSNTK
jgi:hypothetical protein